MRIISLWLFAIMIMFTPLIGLAEEPVVADAAATVATEAAAVAVEAEVPVKEVIEQALKVITDWKDLGWKAGLLALITLLLSTLKVSLLRTWLWDKLGDMKVFAAPVLGMIAVFLSMQEFSWAGALTGFTTGMGAIALHQMLDALKKRPALGAIPRMIIDFLSSILKAPPKKT